MSKLSQLVVRSGDKCVRRSELRTRIAEKVFLTEDAASILQWVNEIVQLSEDIGAINLEYAREVDRIKANAKAHRGKCVEGCGFEGPLDDNNRCHLCAILVVGGPA